MSYDISHIVGSGYYQSSKELTITTTPVFNAVPMLRDVNRGNYLMTKNVIRLIVKGLDPSKDWAVSYTLMKHDNDKVRKLGHNVDKADKMGIKIPSDFATGLLYSKDGRLKSISWVFEHEVSNIDSFNNKK